jgi:hypothetical protein
MQTLLRRAAGRAIGNNPACMIDQQKLPWFAELNRGLRDRLDTDALAQRIEHAAGMLRALAAEILARVRTLGNTPFDDLPTLARLETGETSNLLRAAA